jgi:SpoVK/Ycf46/Vps4 family AAA+-type ATPase
MKQRFYLENFERHRKRAMGAHKRGDTATARAELLRAAEMLFKLAAFATGALREVRTRRAQELVKMAKAMPAESREAAGGASTARRAPTPAGRNDDDKDEDAPETDQWIVATAPDVTLEDVAGLDDVKATIRKRVIYPFQHPEITKKYRKRAGGGVLLYGPPGNGKTMIAKAIAAEVDATFFSIRCSDIISKWVGQAEQNLKALFDAARQHPRAVVFMDETEAIVSKRGGGSTVMNRLIPEFLSQVDGLQGAQSGLLLLGATNRPWDMDEAALRTGRFGELIYVPLPDEVARRHIMASVLSGIPLAVDVDFSALARDTGGYSGADLIGVCEAAKDAPYEREIATGIEQQLEAGDLADALDRVHPSVSAKSLARYEKFRRQR